MKCERCKTLEITDPFCGECNRLKKGAETFEQSFIGQFFALRDASTEKKRKFEDAREELYKARKKLAKYIINNEEVLSPLYNSEGDKIQVTGFNSDGEDCYLISGPCGANRTYLNDLRLECDFAMPVAKTEEF